MADRKLTELNEATDVDITDQLYAVVGETSNRITVETLRDALDALLSDNNLSDLGDASTARDNLGLGTAAEADIVGTVSQSGGDPTGAVIERGSNSNGEYVRYADGTQMCWSDTLYDSGDSGNVPDGGGIDVTWDLPANFISSSALVSPILTGASGTTSVQVSATANLTAAAQRFPTSSCFISVQNNSGSDRPLRLLAFASGRWF